MPSWSPSDPEEAEQEPTTAPASATDVDAARRLLEELIEDAPADDEPPRRPTP